MNSYTKLFKEYKILVLPSICIIIICQLVSIYSFWNIDYQLNKFKSNQMVNQQVIAVVERHYKPGKSYQKYLQVQLSDGNYYPILVTHNEDISVIKVGAIVNKQKSSSQFHINYLYSFKLKDLSEEKLFHHLFMLIVSIAGIYAMKLQILPTEK